jgi:hypothetical protein
MAKSCFVGNENQCALTITRIISAAAFLAACGATQPPIGAPGAMPGGPASATHAVGGGSWMLPEAAEEYKAAGLLVYITNYAVPYDATVYPVAMRIERRIIL